MILIFILLVEQDDREYEIIWQYLQQPMVH